MAPVRDKLEDARFFDRIGADRFHPTVRVAARASSNGGV